ncbi:hypothetical protein NX059_007847 [Plenodomus lindquistii]|nr:hypothetical protein NX059_007847 [Plenodomus lindquistii]
MHLNLTSALLILTSVLATGVAAKGSSNKVYACTVGEKTIWLEKWKINRGDPRWHCGRVGD